MAGFNFKYDDNWYTTDGAKTLMRQNQSELRREYTRMRDVAQKRIARLGTGEYSQTRAYIQHAKGFHKLKDIAPQDLPTAFSELYKFLKADTSTVSGQKRSQAKTMGSLNRAIGAVDDEDTGEKYEGTKVTKSNYWRVIKLLNEVRKQKLTYGSDKLVELAEATLILSNDQFDKVLEDLALWLNHYDEVAEELIWYQTTHEIKNAQTIDMDDFKKSVGW